MTFRWIGRAILALATCALISAAPRASAAVSARDAANWRADLRYMAATIATYHKNAFHSVSKAAFERAVRDLNARIPRLTAYQIVVGLKQVIAMIGDEHTGFGLNTGPPTFFHALPFKPYRYADGYFVQAAAPEYRDIVGCRIERIGALPVDEAMARIATLADASNVWSFRSVLPFLMRGEALHALGVTATDDAAAVDVSCASSGSRHVVLKVLERPFSVGYNLGAPPDSAWVDSRTQTGAPLYLQHQGTYYWYDESVGGTLYVHIKFVLDAPTGETLAAFFARVFARYDSLPANRLVLDIRDNGGGNNELTAPIVRGIVARPGLNVYGKVFVIIGRGTASAAQNLTDRLQRDTNAIFVGEPTSEWPNHYGDPQAFALPHSRIQIHVSSLFWQDMDPRDTRKWTGPDVAAELTSAEYASNRDPAMEAIASWADVPLTVALAPSIATNDPVALETAYDAFYRDPRHAYSQQEVSAEDLGHGLIDRGSLTLALALFQLIARTNPGSSAAYDGLGDTFVAMKELARARAAYDQALRRDPRDAIAAAALSQLP